MISIFVLKYIKKTLIEFKEEMDSEMRGCFDIPLSIIIKPVKLLIRKQKIWKQYRAIRPNRYIENILQNNSRIYNILDSS